MCVRTVKLEDHTGHGRACSCPECLGFDSIDRLYRDVREPSREDLIAEVEAIPGVGNWREMTLRDWCSHLWFEGRLWCWRRQWRAQKWGHAQKRRLHAWRYRQKTGRED